MLEAGYSAEARERAQQITSSFEQFIREHKDEITALQFFYSQPYDQRLTYARHQGAGRDDRQAAAVADAGDAVAGVRDAGQIQGAWLAADAC